MVSEREAVGASERATNHRALSGIQTSELPPHGYNCADIAASEKRQLGVLLVARYGSAIYLFDKKAQVLITGIMIMVQ